MAIARRGPTSGCAHAPACPHDIGPAAAGGAAGVQANAVAAIREDTWKFRDDAGQALGLGVIERRVATSEELARLDGTPVVSEAAGNRPGPAIHLLRPSAATVAESRRRGAERHQAVMAERRAVAVAPVPSPVEEAPMTVTTAPPYEVPCGSCLHDPVCGIKAMIPEAPGAPVFDEPAPGLRVVALGYRVECDHLLKSLHVVEPEPIRAEHGGESWRTPPAVVAAAAPRQPGHHGVKTGEAQEKAERAARVLAAIERHGGDRRLAAVELGMKLNAVAMIVKYAGNREALPA
jgi:hypothetical protein